MHNDILRVAWFPGSPVIADRVLVSFSLFRDVRFINLEPKRAPRNNAQKAVRDL